MTDHSGRTHALYSASSSHRWIHCTGSIQRAAGMPSGIASSYALDGEEAHELLEYALIHQYALAREAFIMSGMQWTHRHDSEETRLDSVQTALDDVQELIDAYQPNLTVYLETSFTFPTTNNDDCGGTSDVTIYVPDLDMMVVADFKHGAGVAVGANDNPQLKFYAVGSRQALREQGLCNSGKTIYRLVILQPRAFHKDGARREWTCNDAELDTFIGEVNFAIAKTKASVPEIVPGPWCRFCPAVSACQEAEQHRMRSVLPTYTDMAALQQTGLPKVAELSVERIAQILSMRDMVEEWLEAVFKQAIALARQGVAIPNKKLVYAQARSKWNGETRYIAGQLATFSGLPATLFLEERIRGITDTKDILRKHIYDVFGRKESKKHVEAMNQAIAGLTIKDTSGNLVLVDREDKRPEINVAALIDYKPPDQP
jgi:hypothetical protein